MLRIGNRLFLSLAILMFQPVSYTQLRALGSDAPNPVSHVLPELLTRDIVLDAIRQNGL